MELEEVESVIAGAWNAVKKANMPAGLHEAAFNAAVTLLVGDRGARRHENAENTVKQTPDSAENTESQHVDFAKIAKKLEIDEALVAKVYMHDADGRLTVDIPLSKLPTKTAAGARELILLVAAGRQSALNETQTDLADLVATLEEHKKYDSKNFKSAHIKNEPDNWKLSANGSSVRVSVVGMTAAAGLVRKYAGGDD